ncbi:MAG: class I SAM-dependent methyltransferase [Deltaproteobacteria bacterium]
MKNKESFPALIIAWCRAYHAEHDCPKIFDDYLAGSLLTEEERANFEKMIFRTMKVTYCIGSGKTVFSILRFLYPQHLRRTFEAMAPRDWDQVSSPASAVHCYMHATGGLALAVSRARYTEDCLLEAVGEGVGQYVILGAGMDTFAFRCPELLEKLQVYEVDHPVTQAVKRQRLTDLGWNIPQELHFVPVDLTRQRLDEALKNSPYDSKSLGFFNWLGVTYYLPRKTVFDTLQTVAAIAPKGSTIIFDYLDPDAYDHAKVAPRGQWLLLSLVGAKARSGFDPSTLSQDLAMLGLRLKDNLSPSDIESRYFQGHPCNYHAQEHVHFACAVVE